MVGGGNGQQMKSLPVKVEMEGKRVLTGELVIPHVKSLNEALNDTKQFLEFSTDEGTLQYISKKTIVHIENIEQDKKEKQPKKETKERPSDTDHLNIKPIKNPYEILGIGMDAYDVEVQHAYHTQAKLYHPDKFINTDLPSEVMEYLMTKSQMINAAYTEVCRIKKDKMADAAETKGFSI